MFDIKVKGCDGDKRSSGHIHSNDPASYGPLGTHSAWH